MVRRKTVLDFVQGILRSYSQIFFSDSCLFAIPLVLVSFLDISAGFAGFLSVATANFAALFLRFDKQTVNKGYYGFNSLLVGLGLGYYYQLTFVIVVIAIIAGFLTLLLTVTFQGILGKYSLPYLSVPFVISFMDRNRCQRNAERNRGQRERIIYSE